MVAEVTVRVRLEYEGASPSALTWPDFKRFVEAIAEALSSLAPDLDGNLLVPRALSAGSVAFDFVGPAALRRAATKLTNPPDETWSDRARLAVVDFGALLRKKAATASIGGRRGALRPVLTLEEGPSSGRSYTGRSQYLGTLERVGGATPKAALLHPNGERSVYAVDGDDLVRELGGLLYRDVWVTVDSERDAATGRLVRRPAIVSVQAHRHRSLLASVKAGQRLELNTGFASVDELIAAREAAREA